MTVVEWPGIPETYWPDTEKPWRVAWGFGVFEDFATEEEAQTFYEEKKASEPADWGRLVREPFNAIKVDP